MNLSFQEWRQLPGLAQAQEKIIAAFPMKTRTMNLPVEEAVGRVLAAPVRAEFAVPGTDIADLDGFAVQSRPTAGASHGRPLVVVEGVRVDTGRPLPPGTDAVVPLECCPGEACPFVLTEPIRPGDGVRHAGSEVEDGALLLPAGHRLRPVDIGPLVAAGVVRVVVRAARVGVIPTGGELVPPGTLPGPGESVASNPLAIRALLEPQGAETFIHAVVPDDRAAIRAAILEMRPEVDLLVVCGGSGRGTRDVAFGVVRSLGETVVDGVAARPGRAFLVVKAEEKPVFSLPGRAQPIALLTEFFLMPLLESWGMPAVAHPRVQVRLGLDILSHPGFTEAVPLSVARVGTGLIGLRQPRGRLGTLSGFRSNARLLVPDGVNGYRAGERVMAELLDELDGPERTVLVVGAVDGLEFPCDENRIVLVPCKSGEARALLDRSACHLATFEGAAPPGVDSWPHRLPDGRRVVLAAPPGLGEDGGVNRALESLGLTR